VKRLGLRAKFILLTSSALAVAFALIAFILVRSTSDSLRTSLTNESRSFATLSTDPIGSAFVLYQDSGRVRILQQIQKFTDLDSNITNVSVVDTTGKVLFSQNEGQPATVSTSQAESFKSVYINTKGGTPQRIISPYIDNTGGHRYSVVYEISSRTIQRSVRRAITYILVISLLSLVLTAVLLYLAVNNFLLRPIQLLSIASLAISRGDLERKIEVMSRDEVADLASAVRTMADSLRANITKLKEVDQLKSEFMMIASHNLRTPLTIIQGYLETMASYPLTPEVAKLVEIISANSERLHILSEDILTISQIEANHQLSADKQPVDLTAVLKAMGDEFTILAKEKGVSFAAQLPPESYKVKAAVTYLRSAIWNIMDNALKFTAKDGHVTLSLTKNGDFALISIADTGIGIAPDEIPKLFTKFHRATSTLQYEYEGVGIGLYITKLVVTQFGGDVSVASTLGKGTTFTIRLPILSQQTS